jgi:hypothetical protein
MASQIQCSYHKTIAKVLRHHENRIDTRDLRDAEMHGETTWLRPFDCRVTCADPQGMQFPRYGVIMNVKQVICTIFSNKFSMTHSQKGPQGRAEQLFGRNGCIPKINLI